MGRHWFLSSVLSSKAEKLEATFIDNQVKAVLKYLIIDFLKFASSLSSINSYIQTFTFINATPEIELFLDLTIWWCCTRKNHPTPGFSLFNLNLINSSSRPISTLKTDIDNNFPKRNQDTTKVQKILLLVLESLIPYLWKTKSLLFTSEKTINFAKLHSFYLGLEVINFLLFLRDGDFTTLPMRLLGVSVSANTLKRSNAIPSFIVVQQLLLKHFSSSLVSLLQFAALLRLVSQNKTNQLFSWCLKKLRERVQVKFLFKGRILFQSDEIVKHITLSKQSCFVCNIDRQSINNPIPLDNGCICCFYCHHKKKQT